MKTGIQPFQALLDTRFRGYDGEKPFFDTLFQKGEFFHDLINSDGICSLLSGADAIDLFYR